MSLELSLLTVEGPLEKIYQIVQEKLLESNTKIQNNLVWKPILKLAVNFRQKCLENIINCKLRLHAKKVDLQGSDQVKKHLGLRTILVREDVGANINGLNAVHKHLLQEYLRTFGELIRNNWKVFINIDDLWHS